MKCVSYLKNLELNELLYIVQNHIERFLVSFSSHIWSLNQQTEPTLTTQIYYNLPPNVVQSLQNFDFYWEFTIIICSYERKQTDQWFAGLSTCNQVNDNLELDHTQSVHSENSEIREDEKYENYPDTGEKDHVRQAALPVFSRHSPSDVVVCHFPPDNDPKVHINKRNSCFVGGLWKLFLGLNLPEIWTRLLSYV